MADLWTESLDLVLRGDGLGDDAEHRRSLQTQPCLSPEQHPVKADQNLQYLRGGDVVGHVHDLAVVDSETFDLGHH